jgi:hypothetical protein
VRIESPVPRTWLSEQLVEERRLDGAGEEGVRAVALCANSTATSRVICSTTPFETVKAI